jgi:hypothetical protein
MRPQGSRQRVGSFDRLAVARANRHVEAERLTRDLRFWTR